MSTRPSWLNAAEHGSLGEARARALLLERFWVLERSVDIHGADYLIQRKLTRQNFLDKDPPRLGIVQVKFIRDASTTIFLDASYVLDEYKNPYSEFFCSFLLVMKTTNGTSCLRHSK